MIMPPRFTLGSLMSFAMHPRWAIGALKNRSFQLANVVEHVGDIGSAGTSVIDYVNAQFDRSATWKDVEWLRAQWSGKLVIKGERSEENTSELQSLMRISYAVFC